VSPSVIGGIEKNLAGKAHDSLEIQVGALIDPLT